MSETAEVAANKALVAQFFEAFSASDFDAALDLMDDDATEMFRERFYFYNFDAIVITGAQPN